MKVRMAIRHQWGLHGTLATRQEIKDYLERVGGAENEGCHPESDT